MAKKTIFSCAILLIFLSLALGQTRKVKVMAASADIHIEPFKNSTVIGQVKRGTVLTLFDSGQEQKSWFYVSFYSEEKWATITGFVEASKVELIRSEPEEKEIAEPQPEQKKEAPEKKPAEVKKPVEKPKPEPKVQAKEPIKEKKVEPQPKVKEEPLISYSGKAEVINNETAIRAGSNSGAKLIQEIKAGTLLELTGRKGEWLRVKYPRPDGIVLVGFIHQDQVQVLSDEPKIEFEKVTQESAYGKPAVKEDPPPDVDGQAQAKDFSLEEKRMGLGFVAGFGLPADSHFKSGFALGGTLVFPITQNVSIELAGFGLKYDVTGDADFLSDGSLSVIPILLSLQGRFQLGKRMVPYALAGMGYYANSFTTDSSSKDAWNALGFDIDESVKNGYGFHFGAGLDYFFSSSIALNADVRYLMASIEGSWSFTDQISGVRAEGEIKDINLNSLLLGIGVKLFFKLF